MDSYRVTTVNVPESPIVSGAKGPWHQQRCDSLHCHEEWWGSIPPSSSFSPAGTQIIVQERAVVGSVYRLPWRYSLVQYYPQCHTLRHNEHHLHNTLCRAHFLWTTRTRMLPFIWLAFQVLYERAQVSPIATIRPRKSHSSAIVEPRKFHEVSNALQVFGNPECRAECGAQLCHILRLPLLTHAQSKGDQHPTR